MREQDLSQFVLPPGFRGRPAWFVQLWWLADALLFRPSPQFAYAYRAWLLRVFGARVGMKTVIRPTARITYPWKVSIGDYSWIGDDVTLYSLGEITIGEHSVVSQKSYLCAADHDYARADFPIRARPIIIGSRVWVAADVFVGPGVEIGAGAVVGARSTVLRDIESETMAVGSPARTIHATRPQQPCQGK